MVEIEAQAARHNLGVVEELIDAIDRPPGNSRPIEGKLKRPVVQPGEGLGDGGIKRYLRYHVIDT